MAAQQIHIIGAGIVGAAIAWELVQRGRQVCLTDAGTFGGEASSAAAGMLAPGGEFPQASAWAQLALQSRRVYPRFVHQLESVSRLTIDFRECGALELAYSPSDWTALQSRVQAQEAYGISATPVEPARYVSGVNTEGLYGAMHYPEDAVVDPLHLIRALRVACEQAGVQIQEHHPVSTLPDTGPVILAAGAWSGPLLGATGLTLPIKGHLIGYDLPPLPQRPILRSGHTYLLQRASGFTIAGSDEEPGQFDKQVDPERVEALRRQAGAIWPPLAQQEPVRAWTGLRPATVSGEPQLQRCPGTNIWTAFGHYRNGILLAPVTAQLIADAVTQDRDVKLT